MSRKIRVLHIIQNLNYGGMERLLADIVRRTDPSRFESHILCFQYLGRFAEGLQDVATLHMGDPLPRYSLLWPGPLIAQIGRIAPDVVHTHSGVWYKASFAARRAGVRRLVHTEHGRQSPDPWRARMIDGLASRHTDVIVAVSEALAHQMAKTVVSDATRLRVIENGVDTDRCRPRDYDGELHHELGIPRATPIVGSVGRLERIKGYDVMIEAFARLRAMPLDGEAPVLAVIGEGTQRPQLESRVRALGLEKAVHLLGWRDDVERYHAAFSLFTLSSRSEGTSVSLLEAMSAGLCPVVTRVGGNAAVLGSRLRHRLAASEDPESLATAWHAALSDPVRTAEDARSSRARVLEHFGLERMVEQYATVYAPPVGEAASATGTAGATALVP